MTKARLTSILVVAMLALAVTAAVFNYANNGRITWRAVVGLLFFVSLALGIRGVAAAKARGSDRQVESKTP